jgi:hypothetical protein
VNFIFRLSWWHNNFFRLDQFSATGVPPQVFRCAANFYNKFYIRMLSLEKGNVLSFVIKIRYTHTHTYTHTGSSSIVLSNMCNVVFSYPCSLIGQVFMRRYIFMAMYSFVPPFREATFCGVPLCVWQIRVCHGWRKVAGHWSRPIMCLIFWGEYCVSQGQWNTPQPPPFKSLPTHHS